MVHNHLFTTCLPRNQEHQPPKTDHSSLRQCKLSHIVSTAFLSTQNIGSMSHPPYSPDLAPNGFFLFPYVKNEMRRQRFSTPAEAVNAFRMHVLEVPQSEWQKCFGNWFKRMQYCCIKRKFCSVALLKIFDCVLDFQIRI